MAIKATVYKANLQIADMDRGLYATHQVTLAREPSETDERMMVRLLAFVLNVPADDHDGALAFARGAADAEEPDLWQRSLAGDLRQWIEVGQPDERRLVRAAGRAERVALYVYSSAAHIWWAGVQNKLARLNNLAVWQLPSAQSQALAALAARSMQLQVTVQDGQVWVGDAEHNIEVQPVALKTPVYRNY
ncbi:MAG: YaeQ family protein [Rubrivivax sp.]|nr:YaeQ family protein [Rubrivivax sp.]